MKDSQDALVPVSYETASKLKLGLWVSNQRKDFSKLSKIRLSRLNAIGFVWDVFEYNWEQMFSELERYKKENGDALVPATYETASKVKLGSWVSVQRKKSAQLSESRVSRLNSIGFIWRVKR